MKWTMICPALSLLCLSFFCNVSLAQLPPVTDVADLDGTNGFELRSFITQVFGTALANIGDLNGDQINDIAITDILTNFPFDDAGSVYVIFGHAGPFQTPLTPTDLNGSNGVAFVGEQAMGQAGWSVNPAGDINQDGMDDLLITALTVDGIETDSGAAYVVYGNDQGLPHPFFLSSLDGNNGIKIYGLSEFELLGRTANRIGDFNGDTHDDIIICGANGDVDLLTDAGICYVLFGASSFASPFDLSTLDGSNGLVIHGATDMQYLGEAAGPAGDFNDDGIDDLYISNRADGRAFVLFGQVGPFPATISVAGLDGGNGFEITGASEGYITPINLAGDVNGDGISDLVVGNPSHNNHQGRAHVLFGGHTWPATVDVNDPGLNGVDIVGLANSDQTGYAVSSAGDVNLDGIDDLLIGAPGVDQSTGAAYVVYGSNGWNTDLNLATANNQQRSIIKSSTFNGLFMGGLISSAGDLNNDGSADLLLGTHNNRAIVVFSRDLIYANGLD